MGAKDSCSKDDLLALVRAIKFAKPDASMRSVHREISQELSQKEGFGFLKEVQLQDVKKVWKKAVAEASSNPPKGGQPQPSSQEEEVLKLYTVGDGSVQTLAKEYSRLMAAEAAAAAQSGQTQQQDMHENYVHVFVDVPADRSGSKPHQALINFQDNNNNNSSDSTTNNNNNKKKKKGKHNTNNNKKKKTTTEDKSSSSNASLVVKIQVAASPSPDVQFPMLLYNADRSVKTFIHPTKEDNGYERIHDWIVQKGQGGALGAEGGTKAYFYTHRTVRTDGPDVISIDVSQLAPPQTW